MQSLTVSWSRGSKSSSLQGSQIVRSLGRSLARPNPILGLLSMGHSKIVKWLLSMKVCYFFSLHVECVKSLSVYVILFRCSWCGESCASDGGCNVWLEIHYKNEVEEKANGATATNERFKDQNIDCTIFASLLIFFEVLPIATSVCGYTSTCYWLLITVLPSSFDWLTFTMHDDGIRSMIRHIYYDASYIFRQ